MGELQCPIRWIIGSIAPSRSGLSSSHKGCQEAPQISDDEKNTCIEEECAWYDENRGVCAICLMAC